jgi:hypothetical protein
VSICECESRPFTSESRATEQIRKCDIALAIRLASPEALVFLFLHRPGAGNRGSGR